ncbi:peptide deformylase [Clostridium tyrobutyricum]|jgi:peptide deformylase|uniref:Peptide deformylase n=1 Tax=Clostridium tyrobutyricum DIVETGP TaxID=1408889 RepID=W6N2H0_CLOTY|nr:peptide deformylase [Clostridium tyrobutyricum]AND84990.1 peptide deformylase 2 [Clostridium tyrobutyricum]ANP69555.1 peptide deformylase [Clostridium tyrobutyricum]MBR9648488.1 peptide deformylase [Clostridium tyrobutyricum]MBV4423548.1 peptide deformylase [Clostridium tyrobutyricum]MBV4423789.1 peptide deformylase [Clostridium tyrobutyricum]
MAVKEVLQYGNKALKRVSRKVEKIDNIILGIIKDLKDTLYNNDGGIGLAAPQIGILKRIIIIDLRREDSRTIVLINPKIIKKIGHEESTEGCLSYPGYEGIVTRPKRVIVTGITPNGEKTEYTANGLLAKAFCHEIDHLDGVLYMDKAKKMYKLNKK